MFLLKLNILLLTVLSTKTLSTIYLENCTYAIDLYKQYSNLLWSSNDSRTLHIQAVYSYASNRSLVPGHIYTHISQSLALIPLFIHCKYPNEFESYSYLPLTQCSSTISSLSTKRNYESTRTFLNLRHVFTLNEVPLLYTGEYDLLLTNCSFHRDSQLYQIQMKDTFKFRIEYERAISEQCYSCNRRTSICENNRCSCRSGTMPFELIENRRFCIDATSNCSLDFQRCLNRESMEISHFRMNSWILIIVILSLVVLFGLIVTILYFCRRTSTHSFAKQRPVPSDQSIYMIHRHERTPSTISRTNSTKLSDCQPIDSMHFANEYVSTFYEEYPKIISDQNNGEIVLILA